MGVVKPNFFLVGAPRCGTTSMYAYLRSHPQIFMPETAKEPHYFAPEESLWYGKRIDDLETYLALFTGARDAVRIGEASTHYLASPSAANSIYAFNPQARILIMLRSPVDLLYSLYYHRRQTGKERHATFDISKCTSFIPNKIFFHYFLIEVCLVFKRGLKLQINF